MLFILQMLLFFFFFFEEVYFFFGSSFSWREFLLHSRKRLMFVCRFVHSILININWVWLIFANMRYIEYNSSWLTFDAYMSSLITSLKWHPKKIHNHLKLLAFSLICSPLFEKGEFSISFIEKHNIHITFSSYKP